MPACGDVQGGGGGEGPLAGRTGGRALPLCGVCRCTIDPIAPFPPLCSAPLDPISDDPCAEASEVSPVGSPVVSFSCEGDASPLPSCSAGPSTLTPAITTMKEGVLQPEVAPLPLSEAPAPSTPTAGALPILKSPSVTFLAASEAPPLILNGRRAPVRSLSRLGGSLPRPSPSQSSLSPAPSAPALLLSDGQSYAPLSPPRSRVGPLLESTSRGTMAEYLSPIDAVDCALVAAAAEGASSPAGILRCHQPPNPTPSPTAAATVSVPAASSRPAEPISLLAGKGDGGSRDVVVAGLPGLPLSRITERLEAGHWLWAGEVAVNDLGMFRWVRRI